MSYTPAFTYCIKHMKLKRSILVGLILCLSWPAYSPKPGSVPRCAVSCPSSKSRNKASAPENPVWSSRVCVSFMPRNARTNRGQTLLRAPEAHFSLGDRPVRAQSGMVICAGHGPDRDDFRAPSHSRGNTCVKFSWERCLLPPAYRKRPSMGSLRTTKAIPWQEL